jgi:hypothetical protein
MSIIVRAAAWLLICLGLLGAAAGSYLYWGGHFQGLAAAEVKVARIAAAGGPKSGEPRDRDQVRAETQAQNQAQERLWLYRFLGGGAALGICGAGALLLVRATGRSRHKPAPVPPQQPTPPDVPQAGSPAPQEGTT